MVNNIWYIKVPKTLTQLKEDKKELEEYLIERKNNNGKVKKYRKRAVIFIIIDVIAVSLIVFPLLSKSYLISKQMIFSEDIDDITLIPDDSWQISQTMDKDMKISFTLVKKTIGLLIIYFTTKDQVTYFDNTPYVNNYTNADTIYINNDIIHRHYVPTHDDNWVFIVVNYEYPSNNYTVKFDLSVELTTKEYENWGNGFDLLKTFNEYFIVTILGVVSFSILIYQFIKLIQKRMIKKMEKNTELVERALESVNKEIETLEKAEKSKEKK